MSRIRMLRLESDRADLRAWLDRGGNRYVSLLEETGMPPSAYVLELRVPAIESVAEGWTVPHDRRRLGPFLVRERHLVDLAMPEDYPFRPPLVRFREPLLHPNIFASGKLCWGIAENDASWWRGGDALGTLVERLLQILVAVPECTNPRSPANPAAVPLYLEHSRLFPLKDIRMPAPEVPKPLRFREAGA